MSIRCRHMRVSWSIICARAVTPSPRHQHPIVEIEDDGRIVVVPALEWEVGARTIFGRNRPDTQRANVTAARQVGARDYFRPCKHSVTGEQRRHVASTVDPSNVKRVTETVERQRARKRNRVATIDQSPAEAAFAFVELIEMNARRVLIKPRGNLVLGLLDGDAVNVVDFFSDLVIGKP